jgi:hypothetical protein
MSARWIAFNSLDLLALRGWFWTSAAWGLWTVFITWGSVRRICHGGYNSFKWKFVTAGQCVRSAVRNVQTSVLSEVGLHVLVRYGFKKEAERHELQHIRLTGMVLKSSSESITMPVRQKPADKTDILLDSQQAIIADLCYRNTWARLGTRIVTAS